MVPAAAAAFFKALFSAHISITIENLGRQLYGHLAIFA
tara:strand:+ start:724 stop:837 length:114 start_codon:yes stop_codon:yes gene_type:complete